MIAMAVASLIQSKEHSMSEKTLISLIPQTSFKLPVLVPVLGAEPREVRFEFKFRRKSEFDQFVKDAERMTDAQIFDALVVGWELQEQFTADNVATLLEGCPQVATAVATAYVRAYNAAAAP